jgi:hypothetical protein
MKANPAFDELLVRNQVQARAVAAKHHPFKCCVICGLQVATCLEIAHLDHKSGNNAPDNLAYLCKTHHWMHDADLYPTAAIKLLRRHWQKTQGVPSHKARMKDAGKRAAATRKLSASARKAWATRRRALA